MKKFEEVFLEILYNYQFSINDCCFEYFDDMIKAVSFLHSFFIEDLRKSQKKNTKNLNLYLNESSEKKFNLDSSDTDIFNKDLLNIDKYPMGRFSSLLEYVIVFC